MVRFLVLLGLLGGAMAAPAPAGDVDGDFQIEAYLANAKMHTVQSEEQQAAGQPNGTETGALERRWSWSDINVLCGGRWENKDRWALSRGIDEGMSYLAKHGGQPHMDPGPSACGRVSCSWNTAVFLCNDNPFDYYLDSWKEVSDAVRRGYAQCGVKELQFPVPFQVFTPDNWNVIMRSDTC